MKLWQRFVDPAAEPSAPPKPDRRFKAEQWQSPLFDWIRQSYQVISDHMLRGVDAIEGVDPKQKEQIRFAAQGFIDAMSPTNFPATNPEVLDKIVETRGENLLKGLQNMMADLGRGQLTHSDSRAFEVGRNLAATPGKVVKRTDLYELIHYTPTTEQVAAVPIVIFPPWINRFYILDLAPEKSLIKWLVDQGFSVFMVSWKSADATMKDVIWDDYVAAQVDAIDTVRELLSVEAVHSVGYCVAGTTLAATLAYLSAKGEAAKVASATFFTAQVDFSKAGELLHFVDDEQLKLISTLSPEGYLDGRYLAMTFNLLRGRDLIWNYVTNNYLLGRDYVPFDLLHWNGDVTNLPAKWHLSYLTDLYRDNLLVKPARWRGGRAARPDEGRHPRLCPGGARGSYRAARKRVEDHRGVHRPLALRAGGLGAYRGRGEPACRRQISILDQRHARRDARRVRRGRDRDQGQLVAGLGRLAAPARLRHRRGSVRGCRARRASRPRRSARTLRQTALVSVLLHCTIGLISSSRIAIVQRNKSGECCWTRPSRPSPPRSRRPSLVAAPSRPPRRRCRVFPPIPLPPPSLRLRHPSPRRWRPRAPACR